MPKGLEHGVSPECQVPDAFSTVSGSKLTVESVSAIHLIMDFSKSIYNWYVGLYFPTFKTRNVFFSRPFYIGEHAFVENIVKFSS